MLLLKKFFLAITLLTISASASAVTEHDTSLLLGSDSPDNLTFSYIFAADTTIDDIYLFKIVTGTPSSSLAASATSLELNNSFNIIDFQFALTSSDGATLSTWATTGDSIELSSITGGSTYGIHFKGYTESDSSGFIAGALAIAPVPVPTAAWLFGSALFGLLGISRSRKKTI